MKVVVDNLLTHYEETGHGKPILVLHGWGDNIKSLNPLHSFLSIHYKVIALDLPGFGETNNPPTPWGLTDYAKFTASFLEKIRSKPLYAIIGHSNGGAIAIRGLGNGELSAKKCVLIGSAGIRNVYKGRTKALRLITKTGKAFTMPLPRVAKSKLRRLVYKTVGSDMLVAEKLQSTFSKIVTDDVQADAAKIELPVLLIYGENDEQTPLSYAEAFHQAFSDSTLEVIGGAGHFVHLEKPKSVYPLIEEFLQ